MDDFTGADIAAGMSGSTDSATPSPEPVSTPSGPTAQPGAATTQPAVQTPTPPAKPQGPIPFDVHSRALENARLKATEEYKAKYGWAETANKTDYDQAVAIAKKFSTDKIGYVRELIAEMQADPQLGPALRSEAARALAAGRGAPTMPEPDVDITDANGNVVERTFSATQMAKRDQFIIDAVMAKVDEKYQPVVQTHKTIEAQQQAEHDKAEGDKFATGVWNELKTYPHAEAQKKAIGAEVVNILSQLDENDPRANDQAFLEAAVLRAYHRVVTTKQDSLSRQAAVQDMTTKASGTGVVPGRPPVGAPKRSDDGRFTSDDLAAEFARRRIG